MVGAWLAPALGAARGAAIDPMVEFLNLTPIGRQLACALVRDFTQKMKRTPSFIPVYTLHRIRYTKQELS